MSTSNPSDRAYHHGDLRSALIAAGLRALETTETDAISLRALARELGVSATAVYRHFPDKRALLAALAQAGVEQLGAAQRSAGEAAGGVGQGFAATGRAYVRFALANPALFRLMFTHAEGALGPLSADSEAGRLLHANAVSLTGSPEAARTLELQAWAIAHGLAMLILDGHVAPSDALIDAVVDSETLFTARSHCR